MTSHKPRDARIWVPLALVCLSLVPVASGIIRLILIANQSAPTPEDTRFLLSPTPVIVHIVGATIFSMVGAFQFSDRLRGPWHGVAGRLLVVCGVATALSALWMTLFYPWAPGDGVAVYALRLVFGSAMIASIVLAVLAIPRRDMRSHAAWMMRAYAIAQGAGTQVLTHLPWFVLVGTPDMTARAWLMGAGWMINVTVAECVIQRRDWSKRQQHVGGKIETS